MSEMNYESRETRAPTPSSFDYCDSTVEQDPAAEGLAVKLANLDVQTGWYPSLRNVMVAEVVSQPPTIQGTFKMSLKGLEHWVRVVIEGILDKRSLNTELQSVCSDTIVLSIVRSVCLALSKKLYREMPVQSRSSIDGIGELFDSISIGVPSVLANLINSYGFVVVRDIEFRPQLEGVWIVHLINLALREDSDILQAFNDREPLLPEKFPSLNKTFSTLFKESSSQLAQSNIFPTRFKSCFTLKPSCGDWTDVEHGYELSLSFARSENIRAAEGFIELSELRARLLRASAEEIDSNKLIGDYAKAAKSWATKLTILELKAAVKERVDGTLSVNECISKAVYFVEDVEDLFTRGGEMWQLMSQEEDGTFSTPFEVSHDEVLRAISMQHEKAGVKIPPQADKVRGPGFDSEGISLKRRELVVRWSQHLLQDSQSPESPSP